MASSVVDPAVFLEDGVFREGTFIEKIKGLTWEQYRNQNVLVRGCSTIIPPWAYMYIAARLAHVAKAVRYGNEHDNVVVYRATLDEQP
jgi:hypothetical protein